MNELVFRQKLAAIEADIVSAAALCDPAMREQAVIAEMQSKIAEMNLDADDIDAILNDLTDISEAKTKLAFAPMAAMPGSGVGGTLGRLSGSAGKLLNIAALGTIAGAPIAAAAKFIGNRRAKDEAWNRLVVSHADLVGTDPVRARAVFDLLHSTAPNVATNTPVAGDLMRQMLSMPQLDLGTTAGLARMGKDMQPGSSRQGLLQTASSLQGLSGGFDKAAELISSKAVVPVAYTSSKGVPCVFDWGNDVMKTAGITDAFIGGGLPIEQADNGTSLNQQASGMSLLPLDAVIRELLAKEQELMQREDVMAQQEAQMQQSMQAVREMQAMYQGMTSVTPQGQPAPAGGDAAPKEEPAAAAPAEAAPAPAPAVSDTPAAGAPPAPAEAPMDEAPMPGDEAPPAAEAPADAPPSDDAGMATMPVRGDEEPEPPVDQTSDEALGMGDDSQDAPMFAPMDDAPSEGAEAAGDEGSGEGGEGEGGEKKEEGSGEGEGSEAAPSGEGSDGGDGFPPGAKPDSEDGDADAQDGSKADGGDDAAGGEGSGEGEGEGAPKAEGEGEAPAGGEGEGEAAAPMFGELPPPPAEPGDHSEIAGELSQDPSMAKEVAETGVTDDANSVAPAGEAEPVDGAPAEDPSAAGAAGAAEGAASGDEPAPAEPPMDDPAAAAVPPAAAEPAPAMDAGASGGADSAAVAEPVAVPPAAAPAGDAAAPAAAIPLAAPASQSISVPIQLPPLTLSIKLGEAQEDPVAKARQMFEATVAGLFRP